MTSISNLDSPYIREGTGENFETLVLENFELGPVLVNYWSPRAGPCIRLYPILDKLIHALGGKSYLSTSILMSMEESLANTGLPAYQH